MQTFTIRDIENLTGIKAHTLRIWEQRYSFLKPKRKESQHRFYDNEDLKKLLRISFLYHAGWKVSKLASLSEVQIRQEIDAVRPGPDQYAPYLTRLIETALDFDEAAFLEVFGEVQQALGFERTILDVAYPYLRKLGLLWSTNNVIPAQEHFASYIIQNRIIVETEQLPHPKGKPEILLICPQGEYHELPLLFINYLMRKSGWKTLYLGVNIGRKELLELATLPHFHTVYLHLITNFTGLTADDYLEDICTTLREKTIVISGEGIRQVQRSFVNLRLLRSDEQILDFIRRHGEA